MPGIADMSCSVVRRRRGGLGLAVVVLGQGRAPGRASRAARARAGTRLMPRPFGAAHAHTRNMPACMW